MARANGKQRKRSVIDLSGKRFGKLVAIEIVGDTSQHTNWLCKCDCGNTRVIRSDSLRNGRLPSCGCAKGTFHKTHGMKRTRVYGAWHSMHQRCRNTNILVYKDYGGRGIRVCERWKSFEAFYEDMGDPPSGYSLDRIDNSGNYEPGNCRWATWTQQNRNTRATILVAYDGAMVPLMELADRFNIPHSRLRQRLNRGWDISLALTAPTRRRNK